MRSKVYVAMDFSGEEGGRVLDNPKDIKTCDKPGPTSKDGYVPFRYRQHRPDNQYFFKCLVLLYHIDK